MKILISESDLRNLLVNRLGIDLTGEVEMITSNHHVPQVFQEIISNDILITGWMNDYGPMFIIHTPDKSYLYQKQRRNRPYLLVGSDGKAYEEEDLFNKLGIPPIGLNLDDIVNTFGEEEE